MDLIYSKIDEAERNGASFVEFQLYKDSIAFVSNISKRKSTRRIKCTLADIKEYEKTLKQLDHKSLLFFGNLSSLSFTLLNGKKGLFERRESDGKIEIVSKMPNDSKDKIHHWIRFPLSDYNYHKPAIAFALAESKSGGWSITPSEGNVFCDGYLTNLDSGLKFYLNAPFILDDEKDELIDSPQNTEYVQQICTLIASAIKDAPGKRLMNAGLLSALPNRNDEISEEYAAIYDAAVQMFIYGPYIKTTAKTMVSWQNAITGDPIVKELFPTEELETVLGIGERWVREYPDGSREKQFVESLSLHVLTLADILKEFAKVPSKAEKYFSEKPDIWLRNFYFCCMNAADDYPFVVKFLKNTKIFRAVNGKLYNADDIYIIEKDFKPGINGIVSLKQSLIHVKNKEDKSEQLERFLTEQCGLALYNSTTEAMMYLEQLAGKRVVYDKKYCSRLLWIAEHYDPDIPYDLYPVFAVEINGKIKRKTSSEIIIGRPYISEGRLLALALDKEELWRGYRKLMKADELKRFLEFLELIGVDGRPRIIESIEDSNYQSPGRFIVSDYTIRNLDLLLKRRSITINEMIWNTLASCSRDEEERYAYCIYEEGEQEQKVESSLIAILRETRWIPDQNNKLYKPSDIIPEDIKNGFTLKDDSLIFKTFDFGSAIRERIKRRKELEERAKEEGLYIIDKNEYEEFLKWKKKNLNMD